jgi:hypothetical protein
LYVWKYVFWGDVKMGEKLQEKEERGKIKGIEVE